MMGTTGNGFTCSFAPLTAATAARLVVGGEPPSLPRRFVEELAVVVSDRIYHAAKKGYEYLNLTALLYQSRLMTGRRWPTDEEQIEIVEQLRGLGFICWQEHILATTHRPEDVPEKYRFPSEKWRSLPASDLFNRRIVWYPSWFVGW